MHTKKFLFLTLLKSQHFSSRNYVTMVLKLNRFLTLKLINLLAGRGILIKVRELGYNRTKDFYKLCTECIRKYTKLPSRSQIPLIECLDNVDSTNNHVRRRLTKQNITNEKIAFCFSEQQTNGRGRSGKKWNSPYAKNIYQSFSFTSYLGNQDVDILSLNMSLILIKILNHSGLGSGLDIKLPNDIFWRGKKVGGILIEILDVKGSEIGVIVGIGINIEAPKNTGSKYGIVGIEEITEEISKKNYLCSTMITYFFNGLKNLLYCN